MYILHGVEKDTLYTGISNRIAFRVRAHNTGKGARYTRTGGPWKVVFLLPVASKSEALKTEWRIKQMPRTEKLRIIQQRAVDG